MRQATLLCVVASLLLSSCLAPHFEAERTENFIRVHPGSDSLDWIEIEHGLTKLDNGAQEYLSQLLKGRRLLPVTAAIFTVDLDEQDFGGVDTAEGRAAREMFDGFRVIETRLVEDEEEAPTIWRECSIEPASKWLNSFSGAQLEPMAAMLNGGLFLQEQRYDDATAKLLEDAQRAGRQLWRIEGDSFVFEGPVSSAFAEKCKRSWNSDGFFSGSGPAPAVAFDGTNLRLHFAPDANGWLRTTKEGPRDPTTRYHMRKRLKQRGFTLEPQESYAALRASAGLP